MQGNVYMIAGGGGNTTVQIGPEAVVVVDTQPAALARKLLEAIAGLSAKPIRHIIVTKPRSDTPVATASLERRPLCAPPRYVRPARRERARRSSRT